MGLLRRHGHESGAQRFRMREELVAIGDDSWIEDSAGNRVYKANGKVARLRDTFVLEDVHGNRVARIKERPLHVRDSITIDLGSRKATVKKALVGVRSRFHIELERGEDLKAHGNVVEHEYEIEQGGETVATVSKRWFRVRDTYGVEIQPGADVPLILAITVAIDDLTR